MNQSYKNGFKNEQADRTEFIGHFSRDRGPKIRTSFEWLERDSKPKPLSL